MEEIKEQYRAKKNAMKEKYAQIIESIAIKNGVDMGVAFDMLEAIARGGNYQYDGELDLDELKNDYEEIVELSKQILAGI